MDSTEDLDAVLQRAFDESTRIYKERGFQRRIGFGKKPAQYIFISIGIIVVAL